MTDKWWRAARGVRGALYRNDWKLAVLLAGAIVASAAFLLWPRQADPISAPPAAISAADLETAQDRTVIVYVNGAVKNPGLYTLLAGWRVVDAIVAAGGLTPDADATCLPNLAAHLKDAKQILVPFAGHCGKLTKKAKLDVNTATRDQLLTVPGMDPVLADAIISYREANGGFQALTELKSSMGIDATLYKQLAKSLTVP
jgi:competence protein ComEA